MIARLILFVLLVAISDSISVGRSSSATGPVCPADDGSRGAPNAIIQRPNLLNRYAKTIREIGCKVAGVDYAVGYGDATLLIDWYTASQWDGVSGHGWVGKPGVTITGSTAPFLIRVDATNGVRFEKIDFSSSARGSAAVAFLNGSSNGRVSNSKFGAGAGIAMQQSSQNLTVTNNVMDGGGASNASAFIVISYPAGGNITLQYNWFKNFPQHVIELNASTNLDYRYNLIENGGMRAGAHLNILQAQGNSTNRYLVEFNTFYQTPQAAGGEGFQFYIQSTPSATLQSPICAYNTMIAAGSNAVSYMIHGSGGTNRQLDTFTNISGSARITSNYFDVTGAFGAYYVSTPTNWPTSWIASGNFNMVTGASLDALP
jgi:hypothetical protein